jgi:hypothetical protein
MLRPALRRIRKQQRMIGRLLTLERQYYAGALHPSMWRRGFTSNRVYSYPGIEDRSLPYITDVAFHRHANALNSPSAQMLVQHKQVFAEALTARGLAGSAPETYGIVSARGFRARSADALERLRAQDLVVLKPTAGYGGGGVRLVPASEAESTVTDARHDLVVQERVVQHPELRAIHPGGLNTVRVLAVRLPDDGPVLAAAVHRWGNAASGPVDNLSAGGISSSVDVATGRLGPARGRARGRHRPEHDRHPDTGAPITGVVVPQWPAVCALALRLMDAFPELDVVGWDIAVSDRGPLVIEGNGASPAVSIFQFHGPFVHDPRVRRFFVGKGMLPARREA